MLTHLTFFFFKQQLLKLFQQLTQNLFELGRLLYKEKLSTKEKSQSEVLQN